MEIHTKKEDNCYVVTFPDYISLESMKNWGFKIKSNIVGGKGLSLLIDTNSHNFESMECLKWLRDFLSEETSGSQAIDRVAFVQPVTYRIPEVVSDCEAYFSDIDSARKWLRIR